MAANSRDWTVPNVNPSLISLNFNGYRRAPFFSRVRVDRVDGDSRPVQWVPVAMPLLYLLCRRTPSNCSSTCDGQALRRRWQSMQAEKACLPPAGIGPFYLKGVRAQQAREHSAKLLRRNARRHAAGITLNPAD